jgi:hypothetical protein
MLTKLNLTFYVQRPELGDDYWLPALTILPDLGHLTRLSHLSLDHVEGYVEGEDFACLSVLTNLTCLNLQSCTLVDCVTDSLALVALTGLVSLGLCCEHVGLSVLPRLNLEEFQSLTLLYVEGDMSVLNRATRLSSLSLSRHSGQSYPDWHMDQLGQMIPRMMRLRSLELSFMGECHQRGRFPLSHILRVATELTCLRYWGPFSVAIDLKACGSLPGLRVLQLTHTPEVGPACWPALQAMCALTELALWHTGMQERDVTSEVKQAFNCERVRRGWPRLKLSVF